MTARVRPVQAPAGALPRVDRLGVGVQADLHRADRQIGEPRCNLAVQPLPVALNLQLDPGRAEYLRNLEEVRHHQGLAAAQHDVGNPASGDVPRDPARLLRVELIGQRLAGRRFGAAMKAGQVAVAGHLPAHQQRCPETVNPVRHACYTFPCNITASVKMATAAR
jgi:hypothetical protein